MFRIFKHITYIHRRRPDTPKIMITRGFILVAFIMLSTTAISQRFHFGNSISFMNPIKDLGRAYQRGFGINANFEYDIPGTLAFVGETGWSRWEAQDLDGSSRGPAQVIHAVAGIKLNIIGPLYAEGRTGYYFGDFDRFVFIPAAGLRLRRFDVNIGYQVVNELQFIDTRIGILWARSR